MDSVPSPPSGRNLTALVEEQVSRLPADSNKRADASGFITGGQAATERLSRFQQHLTQSLDTGILYQALSQMALRRLIPIMEETERAHQRQKQAHYISMEWLMGPQLDTALESAGLYRKLERALGTGTFQRVLRDAADLGLGNGGLGRLAACYIDAFANLHLPVKGYGLFFEKGFFQQDIVEGRQVDRDDPWLAKKSPWLIKRGPVLDATGKPITVEFGGRIEEVHLPPTNKFPYGFVDHRWVDTTKVVVSAFDLPVPSQDGKTVIPLRLWKVNQDSIDQSHPLAPLLMKINERLYPGETDNPLRLLQEHVLTSASLQDIRARHERRFGVGNLDNYSQHAAVQLNDTHPALAVLESIRLLQARGMDWHVAIPQTVAASYYTNHTLAPEALEKWSTGAVQQMLPRHLGIAKGLGDRLMHEISVKALHGDISHDNRPRIERNTALVDFDKDGRDGPNGIVHMARVAAAYTTAVNGVSALHGQLLRAELFPELVQLGRDVGHITNGITQRRWLQRANGPLSDVMDHHVGPGWVTNLGIIDVALNRQEGNVQLQNDIMRAKAINKTRLASYIGDETGIEIRPGTLIDSQVKRFHEYKRQFMNILHTVALYLDIRAEPGKERPPIAKVFSGKAAPTYETAKDYIGLIHQLAPTINGDSTVGDKLKLVFLKDYSVSTAQIIIPASDISEQISTAGMEASGTSNMKFALNGALTVGTRDGANIEIGARAGESNFFFFGIDEKRVAELRRLQPHEYRSRFIDGEENARLRGALEFLSQTLRSSPSTARYAYLAEKILGGDDHWMVAADFNSYWAAQTKAHDLYRNPQAWAAMAIINIRAGAGFSADGAAAQYAEQWGIRPRDLTALRDVEPDARSERVRSTRSALVS